MKDEFKNAFPKSITSLPVTYGTADLLKVTVNFNYDRYVVTRSGSTQPEYGILPLTN